METCQFGCEDGLRACHFPRIDPHYCDGIRMVMISEAFPADAGDYFDGGAESRFIQNTNSIFNKLGFPYKTFEDYLQNGIYLTTAIKCIKKDYLVASQTIDNCSTLLEKELELFPNIRVMMLMGDFAIKAVNQIWKRKYKTRVIPAGSTYKIRKETFESNGVRFFPSYTQTGDSFGIEKVKVEMITDDVKRAMQVLESA